MSDLLPCPFCCSTPILHDSPDLPHKPVECPNKACPMSRAWPSLESWQKQTVQAENARLTSEVARLRERFACAYAGTALYRDDGELSDARVKPYIDFKRDSIEEIDAKILKRANNAAEFYNPAID